jgi:hypothetical protein
MLYVGCLDVPKLYLRYGAEGGDFGTTRPAKKSSSEILVEDERVLEQKLWRRLPISGHCAIIGDFVFHCQLALPSLAFSSIGPIGNAQYEAKGRYKGQERAFQETQNLYVSRSFYCDLESSKYPQAPWPLTSFDDSSAS